MQNNSEAVKMYAKAMTKGIPLAYNDMGYCYNYGLGVETDTNKGLEHYQKAAELGCGLAWYNIGNCYEYGKGVPIDPKKSVIWYVNAANYGVTSAHVKIGTWYYEGKNGLDKDLKKALGYLRLSAKVGEKKSVDLLKKKDLLCLLLESDWPQNSEKVNTLCFAAIIEMVLCTSTKPSGGEIVPEEQIPNWLPPELSDILLRQMICLWPHDHTPVYKL